MDIGRIFLFRVSALLLDAILFELHQNLFFYCLIVQLFQYYLLWKCFSVIKLNSR